MSRFGISNTRGVMDLTEWHALRTRLGMDDNSMRIILDPAVRRTAIEVRDQIKSDTPVKTGNLRDSIEDHMLAPSDHAVETFVWYAPIVESRPPSHGSKPGAMFARNLDFAEQRLRHNLDDLIQTLVGP